MLTFVVDGYERWHETARSLVLQGVAPGDVEWCDKRDPQITLGASRADAATRGEHAPLTVPRSFVARAKVAAHHRDPRRWPTLYRLLWRIARGERRAADDPLDEDAQALEKMVREVKRDEHKMHAFVRFRRVSDANGDAYVAFHRPDHFVVRLAAPFFVERFRSMRWSILTPDECVHWSGVTLTFTSGVERLTERQEDELEEVWRTYYAAIFNPARVNPDAMVRELPVRHWATLPETRVIPALLKAAPARVDRMLSEPARTTSARPFVPAAARSLDEVRVAAESCQGCPLFRTATQVVFGEGPTPAQLMLIGEQPGDEEDLSGRPFVGPAGRVLTDAMAAAGLVRGEVYVTNAVKHFTFRREGKRRIHERPRVTDVRACRPWLEAEIRSVSPAIIVCLGSTAAQALLGPRVRIQRDRGQTIASHWARHVIPTYHPSAVLRAEDALHGRQLFEWLVEDLRNASERSRIAAL